MEPKQLSRRDGNQQVGEGDAEKMPQHGSPAQPSPARPPHPLGLKQMIPSWLKTVLWRVTGKQTFCCKARSIWGLLSSAQVVPDPKVSEVKLGTSQWVLMGSRAPGTTENPHLVSKKKGLCTASWFPEKTTSDTQIVVFIYLKIPVSTYIPGLKRLQSPSPELLLIQ